VTAATPQTMKIVRGSARKKRRSNSFRSLTDAGAAHCTCDACRGRLTTIRLEKSLEKRGGRASPDNVATIDLSPAAVHGPARIVIVIGDEGVEQAFGLKNFRVSGISIDGYATEDDLCQGILSAISRPLPASALNSFLRLPAPTRAEFLARRGLDEGLAMDALLCLGLKDLLPPIQEARVESFEDDCLVLAIGYV
jgi:hypothetical protein